jgi:hypothetical protein
MYGGKPMLLNKLFYKVAVVMISALVWLVNIPTAQATGYYSGDYASNNAQEAPMTDDYFESGKRAGEVIPKDLGTGSKQKNPIDMLKRAGEEVVNNPLKRTLGADDYDRSEIEKDLARNKAARGDFE